MHVPVAIAVVEHWIFKYGPPKTLISNTLVNIILVFGRNNDRNVQCIVKGHSSDTCVSRTILDKSARLTINVRDYSRIICASIYTFIETSRSVSYD